MRHGPIAVATGLLSPYCRSVRTGHVARRTTWLVVDPKSMRSNGLRPWTPMTMRSESVLGCDTQNLAIRLAVGKPRCRPARVPYGIRNQFLKLRHCVPFAILRVFRHSEWWPSRQRFVLSGPFKDVENRQLRTALLRERIREVQRCQGRLRKIDRTEDALEREHRRRAHARWDRQHWTRCATEHFFGHRSEDQTLEAAGAVGADDNHIGGKRFRALQNLTRRLPAVDEYIDVPTR